MSVCLSIRPSVHRMFFSDFNVISYVDTGRWVIPDSMPYDMIQGQGQGHRGLKGAKMANFVVCLLRQYAYNQQTNGELWYFKTLPNFFWTNLECFTFGRRILTVTRTKSRLAWAIFIIRISQYNVGAWFVCLLHAVVTVEVSKRQTRSTMTIYMTPSSTLHAQPSSSDVTSRHSSRLWSRDRPVHLWHTSSSEFSRRLENVYWQSTSDSSSRDQSASTAWREGCREICWWVFLAVFSTRSQAVARIADRTAKNCRGHVT